MAAIKVDVKGLAELEAKTREGPRIPRKLLTPIMREFAKRLLELFRAGAPTGTGRLAKSGRRRAAAFSAKLLFDPIARDGKFRYGWALNSSAKWGHKGYLDRIKDQAQGPAEAAVRQLREEIERLWRA